MNGDDDFDASHDIAIIGLACRFPGARNVGEFWVNLCDGVESISFLTDQELATAGVDPTLLCSPRYVRAAGVLENAELFDAAFFGVNPRDAELLDPQHRLFLECAWEALEDAGYVPQLFNGSIGVYAGAEISTYLLSLYSNPEFLKSADRLQVMLGNDKDYLPTIVSYKLNLRGPSVAVQTACSTSLVAVHLACQGLLSGDCDIALAGGVSVSVPQKAGYLYQEGAIGSPDGHCRAFDARAQGTVGGNGVGIVVLRRLPDAIASGDNIRALIKGSAINNDGSLKVGYAAPSVHGQAEVISQALAVASVGVETIGYVETHGTATPLGDPIEIAALTQAFRASTKALNFCAIGSVKTNIGHLGAAAGVAGLIKTVLTLEHRMIPPSLHFERPHPRLNLAISPFYVNAELREWKVPVTPRRAGVSSFGIGGTNAHMILEEAPIVYSSRGFKPFHLLILSANSKAALEASAVRLCDHLQRNRDLHIADVTFTLQVGRRAFNHRRALVCRDLEDAIAALQAHDQASISALLPEWASNDDASVSTLLTRWLSGEDVDWAPLHHDEQHHRVSLPTYPFERKRFWIESRRPPENASPGHRGGAMAADTEAQQASEPTLRRRDELVVVLKRMIMDLSDLEPAEVNVHATFSELGFDSLNLMQASEAIEQKFGVSVSFRQLLEEHSTIDRLAAHLDRARPEDEPTTPPHIGAEKPDAGANAKDPAGSTSSFLEHVVAEQLRIMSQQLELLQKGTSEHSKPQSSTATSAEPEPQTCESLAAHTISSLNKISTGHELSAQQRSYLDQFIARYNARTRESKRHTQAYRPVLADNRASARFRLHWKELVYPIVGRRSSGSKIWDADGNEYVDLTMGFGVNLFGHSPTFITRALEQQLAEGIQLGPQSDVAGEVAQLICELTGMERVTYCNSGTEAVMTALRLARTVTRRTRIAQFTGSYHGSFDGTLARRLPRKGEPGAAPMAPGVPPGMVEDVLVLDYGMPESLQVLRAQEHTLAAVLVEPVQSRRPDLQAKAFLHDLRQLTDRGGSALIFDEIITGFRSHPGGVQALLGIQADLATYGKVVGGGMPIGVVAGRARWMNAIDGGMWAFGDASVPSADQTFFAGTFCKHPLTMAAARAVLRHLKTEGMALQQALNARTESLAHTLNGLFQQQNAPIRVRHFASLFVFEFLEETRYIDLFFYHLINKGIYIWEGGTCFLSTAHTDEDLEHVIQAVTETMAELRDGGFFGQAAGARDPNTHEIQVVPLTAAQRQVWVHTQLGPDASAAYNECVILRLRGALDLESMRKAIQKVVDRHEALRATFSLEGNFQHIHPQLSVDLPLIDLLGLVGDEQERRLSELVRERAGERFDLGRGPLLRLWMVKLEENHHILVLVVHHIITDSWSLDILLQELSAIYSAETQNIRLDLPTPGRFSDFARVQASEQGAARLSAAEGDWLEQFADCVPHLDLPTDWPRPRAKTYAGARLRLALASQLMSDVRRMSAQHGCTSFMSLLAGCNLLLHHFTKQRDIVIGISAAGQLLERSKSLVGFCVNVVPIRSRIVGDPTFAQYLQLVKGQVLAAYEHQSYPMSSLTQKLNLRRDPARAPLVSVTFNLDRSGPEPEFFGLKAEGDTSPTGFAKSELSMNVVEDDSASLIECTYNTDLFATQTIRHWLELFAHLLCAIVARPDATLRVIEEQAVESARTQQLREREALEEPNLQKLRNLRRR